MLLSEIRLYYAVNHIDISFISFSFSSLSYETAVILEHRPEDVFFSFSQMNQMQYFFFFLLNMVLFNGFFSQIGRLHAL